jgi:hypothetical protein
LKPFPSQNHCARRAPRIGWVMQGRASMNSLKSQYLIELIPISTAHAIRAMAHFFKSLRIPVIIRTNAAEGGKTDWAADDVSTCGGGNEKFFRFPAESMGAACSTALGRGSTAPTSCRCCPVWVRSLATCKKSSTVPRRSVVFKISRLAGVPSDGLARLQRCISLELEREWRWHERPIIDQQALSFARDEVEKLKRLSSELQASLSNPSSYALGSLTWAAALIYEDENCDREAPDPPPGGYGFSPFKDAIATFAERASKAADLLKQ